MKGSFKNSDIMDELRFGYLSGVKVGMELFVNKLESISKNKRKEVLIELLRLAFQNSISDIELELEQMKKEEQKRKPVRLYLGKVVGNLPKNDIIE